MTKIKATPAKPARATKISGENARDPWVRAGLYVVIVAAIVVSGDTLIFLAAQAGWGGWRAWLLPVLIDLPAFLGGRIWLRRQQTSPQTRSYARRLTLAALGASLAGNVSGHLVHAGHLPAGLALVIVAAMVAPIVLAAVLHLDALLSPASLPKPRTETWTESATASTSAGPAAITAKPAPAEPARPAEAPATPGPASAEVKPGTGKARAREVWDAARAEGRTPDGAELADAAGATRRSGNRWRQEFLTDDTAASGETETGTEFESEAA